MYQISISQCGRFLYTLFITNQDFLLLSITKHVQQIACLKHEVLSVCISWHSSFSALRFVCIFMWHAYMHVCANMLQLWVHEICDRPPQTSRKVGIFYSEIQGKIHGKVVFWRNWDFNGFEMFISFLKFLTKYQLSFLLQNIRKLTFSRCSCNENVCKMRTLRHVFSVLHILTCHASKNRNSTSGCRMNLKQLSIQSWRYALSESAIKWN